ncbi:hypothetical protein U1Q18_003398, partial [Sarracenia purpurea var. burkii]
MEGGFRTFPSSRKSCLLEDGDHLRRVFCRPYHEWDPAGSGGPMVSASDSHVAKERVSNSGKEIPSPDLLEKESPAQDQLVYQSESKDNSVEFLETSGGIIMDEFDGPKKQLRARKESKHSSSSESNKSKQVREGTKPSGSRYQVIAHLENKGTEGPPVIAVVAHTGISSHDCVSPAKINMDLVSEGFEALKQAKKGRSIFTKEELYAIEQWLIESGFQAQVNDLKIDPKVVRNPGCAEISPCLTETNHREPVFALPVTASGEVGDFDPEISEVAGEPGEEAIPKSEQGCPSPPPVFRSSPKKSKGSVTVSEAEGENVAAGKGPRKSVVEIQQSIVEDENEVVIPPLQDLVDYSLNVGSVISSAVEMESNFAGGSYTKVGNQYQGEEIGDPAAPKEIEGKPSSLAVDQSSLARSSQTNRKWVDVVSGTQTKGPAIK